MKSVSSGKLTLSVDKEVVAKAKRLLRGRGISMSAVVEDYFRILVKSGNTKLTPVVSELTGMLAGESATSAQKARIDYLTEKYQ